MTLNKTDYARQAASRLESCGWKKFFTSTSLEFGTDLALDNCVGNIVVTNTNGECVATSRVTENVARFFDVKVKFPWSGKQQMQCECTCPVGGLCKHTVAVLSDLENLGRSGDYENDRLQVVNEDGNAAGNKIPRPIDQAPESISGSPSPLSAEAKKWIEALKVKQPSSRGISRELPDHYTDLEPGETGIIYRLIPVTANYLLRGSLTKLEICRIRCPKSGTYSKASPLHLKPFLTGKFPDYLTVSERNRIRKMIDLCEGKNLAEPDFKFAPENRNWFEVIEKMLEDKVIILDPENPRSLERGDTRRIVPFWVNGKNGSAETGLRDEASGEPVTIIDTVPPFYVLPETGTYGPAEISLPDHLSISDWLSAPVIRPEEFSTITEELHLPDVSAPEDQPDSLDEKAAETLPALPKHNVVVIEGTELKPTGRLVLKRFNLIGKDVTKLPRLNLKHYFGSDEVTAYPIAVLEICYGNAWTVECPLTTPLNCDIYTGETCGRILRDSDAETRLVSDLYGTGLESLTSQGLRWLVDDDEIENGFCFPYFSANEPVDQWTEFTHSKAKELKDKGWEILIDESFYFNFAASPEWYAELDEKPESGIEWMEFDYGIEHEGKKISLISALANLLAIEGPDFNPAGLLEAPEDETVPVYVKEEDLLVPVPVRQMGKIYQALIELLNLDDEKLTLHPLQAAQLINHFGDDDSFDDSETVHNLRELGKKIADFKGIKKVKVPKALDAKLRPYQIEGLSWLQFLRDNQLNGILADDMGLGKTIQTLAAIQTEKSARRLQHPALIIAPTSVVSNWVSESARFTPKLKVLLLHGLDRKEHFEKIAKHDIVVTSYALLNRDIELHGEQEYHYAILDEAQMIKNPKSKMAKNACSLKAKHRLCLTGTPMENHLGELWSLIHFLMPGFLGNHDTFRKNWQRPIENHDDTRRREVLVRKISPILLRRTKDLVLKELPPRTDIVHEVILDKAQADLYESVRAAMDKRVRDALQDKGLNRSHIIVLDALLKLRQICCHPNLLKTASAKKVKQSAKLEAFEELVRSQVEAGRRILVFSQFTSMISILEKSLAKLKIDHVKLTGSTTRRKEVIDSFQNGDVPVFLISLKAGGSGLNLTAADCVIHYDPWWNPAVEEQATARAHRMGQDNPVFVYRLVTKGSIEERILELQEKKAELARAVLAGGESGGGGKKEGGSTKSLSKKDLEMLFAPIDQ